MRMLQTSRIFSSNLTIKICQRDAREPNREQLKTLQERGVRGDFTWCLRELTDQKWWCLERAFLWENTHRIGGESRVASEPEQIPELVRDQRG